MAYLDGAADNFDFNVASGSLAAITASGSNLAAIAVVGGVEFGTPITVTQVQIDGNDLADLGIAGAFYSGNALFRTYAEAISDLSADSLLLDWDANPLQMFGGIVVYDDVASIDNVTSNNGDLLASPGGTISVNLTGCTPGELIGAWFAANADDVTLDNFDVDGLTGHTLQINRVNRSYCGTAWVEKVAASENETISVNVNSTGTSNISWYGRAMQLTSAGGGGPTFLAAWAKGSNVVISGD